MTETKQIERPVGGLMRQGHMRSEVGRRIRRVRLGYAGISQREVADLATEFGFVGWSRTMVNRIERGTRGIDVSELIVLAGVLSVPISVLLPDNVGEPIPMRFDNGDEVLW